MKVTQNTSSVVITVPESAVELGLEENCRELVERGYTVLQNVNPELSDRMRAYLLAQGVPVIQMLLRRDPMFAEAALDPKILAIVEFSVGRGALLSQMAATVRTAGPSVLPLHADQNWLPQPFPEQNYMLTCCWVHDEFNEENGATLVVPGTNHLRRHPAPEEVKAREGAIALEAPPGSVAIWDGAVWHSNYGRTTPGERVVTHVTYSRLAMRTVEDYSADAESLIAAHGESLGRLIGFNDGLNTPNGFDFARREEIFSNGRS